MTGHTKHRRLGAQRRWAQAGRQPRAPHSRKPCGPRRCGSHSPPRILTTRRHREAGGRHGPAGPCTNRPCTEGENHDHHQATAAALARRDRDCGVVRPHRRPARPPQSRRRPGAGPALHGTAASRRAGIAHYYPQLAALSTLDGIAHPHLPMHPGRGLTENAMMFLDCRAYLDEDGAVRCGLPAEVRCRFTMRSTDGPIESAMIRCPAGHWFNGPIEFLTWDGKDTHDPGTAGFGSRAGRDCLQRGQHGRHDDGGSTLPDLPAQPQRKDGRPNTAPAYYLAALRPCGSPPCACAAGPPPPVT
jgi:hypothetical protein